jgi:hypothetical protein
VIVHPSEQYNDRAGSLGIRADRPYRVLDGYTIVHVALEHDRLWRGLPTFAEIKNPADGTRLRIALSGAGPAGQCC